MKNFGEPCILEDRSCTECGECDICDLDPKKQCDNCYKCIQTPEGDYAEIGIDDILLNTDDQKKASRRKEHSNRYKIKA